MNEVLLTNVFFMITAAAVVVFTLVLCIALYYAIKILRAVRRIVERIERGSETIADDVSHLRHYLAKGSFISQIMGMFMNVQRGRKSRSSDEDDE